MSNPDGIPCRCCAFCLVPLTQDRLDMEAVACSKRCAEEERKFRYLTNRRARLRAERAPAILSEPSSPSAPLQD